MKKYKIITDSTSDLPQEIIEKLDLTVIPLRFHFGEETYLNVAKDPKLSSDDFYQRLLDGEQSTTSQLTAADYEEHIVPILEAKEDVLILSFSSKLSGTYNSARLFKEEMDEKYPERKIELIDTKSASLGEGLLVYLTALEKQKGASLDELVSFVNKTIPTIAHWFTVNDIDHLRRGGRISFLASFLAKRLNIKPIMHTDNEGGLIPRFKARGRNKAIRELYEQMKKTALDIPQTVLIGHGSDLEAAMRLKNLIMEDEQFNIEKIEIYPIGPVIGSHTGQGVLALFFQATNR